jgi:hypothetical protein
LQDASDKRSLADVDAGGKPHGRCLLLFPLLSFI